MKFKFYLLLLLFSMSQVSCQKDHNGTYLVYKTMDEFNAMFMVSRFFVENEEVQKRLESAFMGKKFNFQFGQDYIVVNSPSSEYYNDLILNKKTSREGIEYYYGQRIINQATLEFRLMRNETQFLVMAIEYSIPKESQIIIPIQAGELLKGIDKFDGKKQGRVIFSLRKVE